MPTPERDAADVRVIPPLVPLAVILLGAVLSRMWPIGISLGLAPWARYSFGGAVLVLAGILLLTPVCVWTLQRFAIQPEEAYLEAKFGDAFQVYRTSVRRWI